MDVLLMKIHWSTKIISIMEIPECFLGNDNSVGIGVKIIIAHAETIKSRSHILCKYTFTSDKMPMAKKQYTGDWFFAMMENRFVFGMYDEMLIASI